MIWCSGTASGPMASSAASIRPAACARTAPSPSASASRTCRQCHNGANSGGIGPSAASASSTGLGLVAKRPSCSSASACCKCQCRTARGSLAGGAGLVQKRERVGRALLLQQLGHEVEPGADSSALACELPPQQISPPLPIRR